MFEYNATTEEARELVGIDVLPRDITEQAAKQYIHECRRLDIDPRSRKLVPIKLGGRWSMHASIGLLRTLATRTGEFAGSDVPAYEMTEDGDMLCTVIVYRLVGGQRCGFGAQCALSEFTTGRNLWASKPRTMLAKVAEATALRRGFAELDGLYESGELGAES